MRARTLAAIALTLGACGPPQPPPAPPTTTLEPPKVCTQEAKVCPDGTVVARIGPHCEFAPCPGSAPPPPVGPSAPPAPQ